MPKRGTQRQRGRLAGANSSNLGVLYDIKMTGRLGRNWPAKCIGVTALAGVLEQETRERLGRFRRRCAVFLYRRRGTPGSGKPRSGKQTPGSLAPPPRGAPESAADG